MGMHFWTLCVRPLACAAAQNCDAERHELHANTEHWHESQFPTP
ncbi:rplA family protein [Pseudomonas congelans]|nr:rplA family protein [Pseudomonas congelans]